MTQENTARTYLSKTALITGSGKKRVGSAVAEEAAKRGYSVMVHYRQSAGEAEHLAAELRSLGARAAVCQADISREDEADLLINRTIDTFGSIDLLVTCAAIWQKISLENTTAADVMRHFEVNTLGTFLCCQKAGLAMVKQASGGCIITVSDWAIERPYLNYAAYFPSKGAIPALTRTLAVEFAHRNPKVRVNCILPGPVMVPDTVTKEEKDQVREATLVKQLGQPEYIAQAVFALAENEFITGVCLPVDGGRTIAGG